MPTLSILNLTPFSGFTDTNQSSYPTANLLINAGYSGSEDPGQNGVAVTSITGKGSWVYGFSSAPSGTSIPNTVSDSNALLLSASGTTAYLNYLISNPSIGYGDVGILKFRGWNKLAGTESSAGNPHFYNTVSNSNFSTQVATLYVGMGISSNSCPIFQNFLEIGGGLIHRNSQSDPLAISDILSFLGYSKIGVIVTNLSGLYIYSSSGAGNWQYSTNGVDWVNFPAVSSFSSLLLSSSWYVRYSSVNLDEQASLLWGAWDQSADQPAGINCCTNIFGGYTAFGSRGTGLGITVSVSGASPAPSPPPSCIIPISTYTVRDLLTSSLRKIGVIQSGELIDDSELEDALETANDIIETWMLERLMCFHIINQAFTLVSGQRSYTIGPCADFDTVRPIRIERAYIDVNTTNPVVTLDLTELNFEQYADLTVKTTTSPIPNKFYYETTFDPQFPWGRIFLWPTPAAANILQLWYWSQLPKFTSINQTINLPPLYKKALRYAIAVESASEYGVEPTPLLMDIAEKSKGLIKRVNQVLPVMVSDPALVSQRRTFNYLTGE